MSAKKYYVIDTNKFGNFGINSYFAIPATLTSPENIFIGDHVRIQTDSKIIHYKGKFIVKKYTGIASNFVAVLGNHKPTVGLPQCISAPYHINDIEEDMVIGENVWIGVNVTLIYGAQIGRGAIIGACSLVNKPIPPYAVAIGTPAKIIASTFTIDEIIEHEKVIYSKEERFPRVYLEKIFEEYFRGKKSIGVSGISDDDIVLINSIKEEIGLESYE